MGHKKVCLACKICLNRPYDNDSNQAYICPECGTNMILLPHRFRPPKKSANKKWDTIKLLIENGLYFQHIYENIEGANGVKATQSLVPYPENVQDAIEFIEKYKEKSLKAI